MSVRLLDRLLVSPKSVLAIGVLFLGIGLLDLYWGLTPLFGGNTHWEGGDVEVICIGAAALTGGVWTLKRRNWARWLLVAWMVLHIALSALRPLTLAIHVAILVIIVAGLFNPTASSYFRSRETG